MFIKLKRKIAAGAPRRIVGFHLNETCEWIAELECGHRRHVRQNPPWKSPHWVTTATGRALHIGKQLDCIPCATGHRHN